MPTGAAALCQHVCDTVCHRVNAMTDESVSVIHLYSFPCIYEFAIKDHWGATENRKLSRTPEKTDCSSHQCRKGKAAPTCMNTSRPTQNIQWWRTHEKKWNEFERHTHQLECNPDFSAWDVDVLVSLNSTGHFRCYPSQELLFRATSDLWRPRIRFKSVVGDPLPSAGLYCMIRVPLSD